MPWQYRFDATRNVYVILLDGHEIKTVATEAEARAYCAEHNGEGD